MQSTPMSDTCKLLARPEITLGGIDFSGGQEDARRGNKKICVAQWLPNNGVSLRCGRDWNALGPQRRRDLPAVIKLGGWWSLDFPFGVAQPTARILGVSTWPDWLSHCDQNLDATAIRNDAKALTERSGVSWAMRRQVDERQKTTWFPLFEQLYRQTIYGAREVLLPLYADDVCILPWKASALPASVVVVEGFPGATIRDVLKLPESYKGRGAGGRKRGELLFPRCEPLRSLYRSHIRSQTLRLMIAREMRLTRSSFFFPAGWLIYFPTSSRRRSFGVYRSRKQR